MGVVGIVGDTGTDAIIKPLHLFTFGLLLSPAELGCEWGTVLGLRGVEDEEA